MTSEKVKYVEFFGVPAVGKTTLVKMVSEDDDSFEGRQPFFQSMGSSKYFLFLTLFLKYGLFFLYVAIRSFGLTAVFNKVLWRGLVDYVTIRYKLNHSEKTLLYDQGVVSVALGLSAVSTPSKKSVFYFVNKLIPANAALVYLHDDIRSVTDRYHARERGKTEKVGTKMPPFDVYSQYLDFIRDNVSTEKFKVASYKWNTTDVSQIRETLHLVKSFIRSVTYN